jgi:hypothetical protein
LNNGADLRHQPFSGDVERDNDIRREVVPLIWNIEVEYAKSGIE